MLCKTRTYHTDPTQQKRVRRSRVTQIPPVKNDLDRAHHIDQGFVRPKGLYHDAGI